MIVKNLTKSDTTKTNNYELKLNIHKMCVSKNLQMCQMEKNSLNLTKIHLRKQILLKKNFPE